MKAFATVIVCALLAAGCQVASDYPIGSTTGLSPDPDLMGTWLPRSEKTGDVERTADGKLAAYVHVLPAAHSGFDILVVGLPTEPGKKGEVQFYRATSGRAGHNRFLNVVMLSPPGEKPDVLPEHGTVPILYRFEVNGDLALFTLDEDKTIAAIKSGAIKGTVEQRTTTFNGKEYAWPPDIRVTAKPTDLDSFFATEQALTLFRSIGLLKKAD